MNTPEKKKRSTKPRHIKRPIDVALEMKAELDQFAKDNDRGVLIKALRDQFLLTRYDAASLVEKSRLAALNVLFERIPNMSDNMLLRAVSLLSEVGAADLVSVVGAPGTAPPLIALQQNLGVLGQTRGISQEGHNPIKDAGQLLESLEHIATYFRGQPSPIIELQSEEKKNEVQ